MGKLLVKTLEVYCRKNNYKEIILGVNKKALAAHDLYTSLGYIMYAEKEINSLVIALYFKKAL
ncbi:MAG: GNAT family N-acetyltransferase [Candidatus Levyibacteriota bacterium]